MTDRPKEFREYREKMNHKLQQTDNKVIKRIMNLDTNAYMSGALNSETKEMLGLVASMVLRCDDCISYHLEQCHKEGISNEAMYEIFSIANLVGGTIVIPHTRRALEYWEALNEESR
ncbi:MAG: carboxymuconolactone decarboxylase family protein [Bacteroidales bacterium]|nr:carboxymuconolactone decarboxylase family protein [Bacteroidales bacterium]MBS3774235.1 carboxymuconolactone decarboxylase family protein [Bacteroidales bacterium]